MLTASVLGTSFISCTVALYLGRLSGSEYVNFLTWTVPLALAGHHAANVAQKMWAKAQPQGVEDVGKSQE